MVSMWLTIAVALIGVLGTLCAGWLTGRRADRQLRDEREARQFEQDRASKKRLYADVMRAARAFGRAVVSEQGVPVLRDALGRLADVTSDVALETPDLAERSLGQVLEKAERLLTLAVQRPATNEVITETLTDFHSAVEALNGRLNAEINPRRPH
ncbi:hypothetical protein E1263_22500 [Kribbella antibiotica]|uniref:Uncharacterized protein n=1 Tax=Kribbella antibiotica TaxID=190195 RepID=A0A4R4ZGE4_9ACTN|nr:hypothetical protein [Kribbella antibiotica]TDD57668.1 hypothetical protein E1263_22500 [Kribbella antibiotica]